jgi:hypothetical protein
MNRVDAAPEDASSGEIRDNIRRTRAAMDDTLSALSARLHPRSLLDEAIDSFTSSHGEHGVRDMGNKILESIKTNPIPLGLIATGVTWMIIAGTKNGEKGAQNEDLPGDEPHAGRRTSGRTLGQTGSAWEHEGSEGEAHHEEDGENGSRLGRVTRVPKQAVRGAGRGIRRGGRTVAHQIDEHPLSLGLTAFAAGLVAGIMIPPSRKEDRVLGERSDRLIERARHAGHDLVEGAKSAVRAGADAAQQRAQEEDLTRSGLKDKTKHVLRDAMDAAGEEFRESRR